MTTITFDLNDFQDLWETSMQSFYHEQQDRFEIYYHNNERDPTDIPTNDDDDDKTYYMYWLEGNIEVIIARKLLIAEGFDVWQLWDMETTNSGKYCILTNYHD